MIFKLHYTASIKQPLSKVFPAAVDPEKAQIWDAEAVKNIVKLSPGPLAQGSKYRGDFKGFGTVTYEFVEYKPMEYFTHATRMPIGKMRHKFMFKEINHTTEMTQEGTLDANILGIICFPLMRFMIQRRFREIAKALDRYLSMPR